MSVALPVVQSWDGENRRIYLKQGVTEFHWVTDIYPEYRNERRINEELRKYEPLVDARGYESKGNNKFTSRFLRLLTDNNGLTTKIVPFDETSEITALGEAITDVADIDSKLFDISSITNPVIINYTPPDTELIEVGVKQEDIDTIAENVVDGINNPVIIDPKENINRLESYLKKRYIDENLRYFLEINQEHFNTLKNELSISTNTNFISTQKVFLTVIVNNNLVDFEFKVYGRNVK